jgi:hypothetical protein
MAVCTSAAAVLLISATMPAVAQGDRAATATRRGWLPREVSIGANLTAAESATATARLEAIERILQQVPALANPEGFEIMPHYFGGAQMLGPGQSERPGNVVEYMLTLVFFHPSRAVAGEGCGCLTVTVNRAGHTGAREIFDEQGRGIYIESPRGDPVPFATQVYDRLSPVERSIVSVLFTSGGELPWRTVTRAEYYNAVIFDTEGKDGAKLADFRAGLEKTPYQVWMEGASQRKQDREQTLKATAAFQTPEEVAKLRKTLEDTEGEVTERFKASEAADRERNQAALALSHSTTGKMRAELDSMTVAERNMPALIDGTLSEGPNATGWRMSDRDSPSAWRVLTPNYDFWRARTSRVEVRSVYVHIGASLTGLVPVVHKALWQAYQKLDGAAFNRLLDVPR